jgi:serine phosphatase RsbU (regulator of sigma subunit)/anti-sigma regulatory factor (Ser/Thr protein kinase)
MVTAASSRTRLLDVLRRVAEPLVSGRQDLALWFQDAQGGDWIWRADACPGGYELPIGSDGLEAEEGWRGLRLSGAGTQGTVWIWCTDPSVLKGLAPALCLAGQMADLEQDRDDLCAELSLCHASLASLFDLSSDPGLFWDAERGLATILGVVTVADPELQAILWTPDGARLRPKWWTEGLVTGDRSAIVGIVGQALTRGEVVVVNHLGSYPRMEPELVRATRVVALPLVSKRGSIGVLEIWSEEGGRFDSLAVGYFRTVAAQAAMVLEHQRMRTEELAAQEVRKELELASRIQESLLLGVPPKGLPYLDVGARAVPSRQVGGDFYDFHAGADGTLDVIVADVMGKGLPAAMIAAAAKSRFHQDSRPVEVVGGTERLPVDVIMTRVHKSLAPKLIELECFVTAVYARFERDHLLLTEGGHTETLLLPAASGNVVCLREKGEGLMNLPLGIDPSCIYRVLRAPLSPGDVILLYSDGVTEARDLAGRMFGSASLARHLRACAHLSAQEIVDHLIAAVAAFVGDQGPRDDLSCVAVKMAGGPPVHRVELPIDLGSVRLARDFLHEHLADLGPGKVHHELDLAVCELLSNIIRHGFGGDREGTIVVECVRYPGRIHVRICDEGKAFDPSSADAEEPNLISEGGLGLFLVCRLVDDLLYHRHPSGGNAVTLIKKLGG